MQHCNIGHPSCRAFFPPQYQVLVIPTIDFISLCKKTDLMKPAIVLRPVLMFSLQVDWRDQRGCASILS
jgi:hypothetical protein